MSSRPTRASSTPSTASGAAPSRTSCRSDRAPDRRGAWRRLVDATLVFTLAPTCAACHHGLAAPSRGCICDACWDAIPRIDGPACRRCGAPRRSAATCDQCDARWHAIAATRALGEHDGPLRHILHALKYERRTSIAPRLAHALRDAAADLLDGADCVVPVPLHPLREWWRGFNQSRLLAENLGPPPVDALVRRRATVRQSALTRNDRWANLDTVIGVRARAVAPLRGATVVIVDDIVTTGATVTACARALRAAGVGTVRVVTAARAVRRSPR